MSKIEERNSRAKQFVCDKLKKAKELEIDYFKNPPITEKVAETLNDLIYIPQNGFRGVVLTAIVGKFLDNSYDPINNFYGCNPRSIFEKGIWYALKENNIPCGKSDPLNVAKNINELNESWAKGRRPQSAALAAVSFLNVIFVQNDDKTREALIDYFFYKLQDYAKSVTEIVIAAPDNNCLSSNETGHRLIRFINEYPEAGTIPQVVVGKLLNGVYKNSTIDVMGADESVFGTNTTSKKPADIWLQNDNEILKLLEVTLKIIDNKRLEDCVETLKELGIELNEVSFICRFPEDIKTLTLTNEYTTSVRGIKINFLEINSYIMSLISLISNDDIDVILNELHNFISDVNRPAKTKEGWNKIFL